MRILIYSYNYSPEPIGIAPLMTELAEGLVQRGHEVRVVTGMPNYPQRQIYPGYRGRLYSREYRRGVLVQRSYVWIRPNPGLVDRILLDGSFVVTSLWPALRGWRPDVILLTSPPLPVCVPAAFLGWFYNCPLVLNLQDVLPEAAVQLGILSNPLMIRVFETLERFAYHSATSISVITDKFRDNLHCKGVAPRKITCIPNWVDVNFIRPLPKTDNAFRAKYGLQDRFVVLYSGNIAHSQGIETVLRAASLLREQQAIAFVIVGEAKALDGLRRWCAAQALELPNLTLVELQPRQELPTMLAAANVGLIVQKQNVIAFNMPSKTQVLMASGRAIIGSVPTEGPAAEAIQRSKAGLVVTPEDASALSEAILALYHDPKQTETMGRNGRQYALEHYSFDQSLKRYEELFESLLAAPIPVMQTVGSALSGQDNLSL